jgi:membrane protease YdiL (CAAX protease family)
MPAPIPPDLSRIPFPTPHLTEVSTFHALAEYPLVKALAPLPVLLLVAPVVWAFFRKTWAEIDAESRELRKLEENDSRAQFRPAAAFLIMAVVLTLQEYYGGRNFYEVVIRPSLQDMVDDGASWLKLAQYDELFSYAWWSAARIIGYVLVPITFWKVLFPRDQIRDMGLRVRGFWSHVWIYALCLTVVLGAMAVVARQKEFLNYYPFYKLSGRSGRDFLYWESLYFAQFFALEFFFRGWFLNATRPRFGSAAIFAMAVPYCMIHFGKPYLEAHAAIIAGVVLGSLAMRTRSIYAGFLVHISVAFLMDFFALHSRGALPTHW